MVLPEAGDELLTKFLKPREQGSVLIRGSSCDEKGNDSRKEHTQLAYSLVCLKFNM